MRSGFTIGSVYFDRGFFAAAAVVVRVKALLKVIR